MYKRGDPSPCDLYLMELAWQVHDARDEFSESLEAHLHIVIQ